MSSEKRALVLRIVDKACMKLGGIRGSTYQLALEFAFYALEAIRQEDEAWLDEIIQTYNEMGVPIDVLNNIVKRLKKLGGAVVE